jgi:hypothetical protein
MRRALLCTVVALVAAPSARAAYAPQLDIGVAPATPATAAALTATVTQASGEEATASERVRFPAQFGFNPGLRVGRCTPAQERAARCGDDSRIGSASARTMLGDFSGPVYLTNDFRFVTFLRGLAGLVQQEVEGYLLLRPDGRVESVLEGLPNVAATLARVAFDGGARSLILTPRTCGSYTFDATFTSHGGVQVDRTAAVRVAGCPAAPHIQGARAASSRSGRVRLSWTLSEDGAATVINVRRLVRAGRFVRPARALRARGTARAGANRAIVGPLAPGRYEAMLTVLGAGDRPSDVTHMTFNVRP